MTEAKVERYIAYLDFPDENRRVDLGPINAANREQAERAAKPMGSRTLGALGGVKGRVFVSLQLGAEVWFVAQWDELNADWT